MRGYTMVASAAAMALLMSGCGRTTTGGGANPAGPTPAPAPAPAPSPPPAPQFPSLIGEWTGSGSVTLTNRQTRVALPYGCERSFSVTTQAGGSFSGLTRWRGTGASSDPYCTHEGRFTATMTADGATSFRVEPPIEARSCTRISGEDVFQGTTSDASIQAEMSDVMSCVDPLGQPYDAERRVTFSVRRR